MSQRTAHDLGPTDLVWDYFSRPRGEDPIARVRAAATAGFAGIGLYFGAWEAIRSDPVQVEALDQALDQTGLVIANIEVLRGWAGPDRANDRCVEHEAIVYEMADRFGSRYVQVIGNYTGTIAEAAVGFGALCDRAADHGLLVGIEWVPQMTNIENAATAADIVERADRPNGGLCFDSWHLTRSTNNLDDLRNLDGRKIFATQFSDGPIVADESDYYTDTTSNRLLPGAGKFALVEMVTELDRLGSIAPIGVEVISTTAAERPIDEHAAASVDAMRSILNQARPN